MTNALDIAHTYSKEWIEHLNTGEVHATATYEDLYASFMSALPNKGMPAKQVVDELVAKSRSGLTGSAGGRFFAWVIGGGLSSALAADWLVSTWDQNAAIYACSPATAVIEEVAGEWIKDLLNLPRAASFAFTTGCQMAHMTGLAAARNAQLSKLGWDVEEYGLTNAPTLQILTSCNRHGSLERAARYLGLGRRSIIEVETDALGRMLPEALEAELNKNANPKIVVLNAGDINIGACDPFLELIPIAKAAGAWVHVDGAFGLMARASRTRRHLLDGVELADSWATDAHKWLNVPFDCGISIVRDKDAHRAAMTVSADYISSDPNGRDQINWNPEWSRRARGVPVYAALKELGRGGVEAMIDRCCVHCTQLVRGIGTLQGAEILAEPTLNQGLVRFVKEGATKVENDMFTDTIIAAINQTGKAFFSGTYWNEKRAMRISVVNWQTNADDVARAINAARQVLKACT